MKIRRSSALAITLAACSLALAMGCSQGPSTNSNGAGTANNSNAAKPAPTAPTAPAATTGSLSTPTNTFKAFYEASKSRDVAGVMRTLSKSSIEFFTAEAKKENKTLDAALTESLKTSDVPATVPETRNEKIEGETATLEVKDDKGNKWDTFNFVRENSEWKIKIGME